MGDYISRDAVLSHKWKVRSYDPSDPDPVTEVVSVSSIMRIPAADVVERPDWITAEHLQEIFQADREGRLRIAARPIEETCGSCRWFERETGKASGKCTRRTKRYRSGLDSCALLYVTQSRKACRGDYEKRSDGGQDDGTAPEPPKEET